VTFPSSYSQRHYRELAVLQAFITKVKRLLKNIPHKTESSDMEARKMHKILCCLSSRWDIIPYTSTSKDPLAESALETWTFSFYCIMLYSSFFLILLFLHRNLHSFLRSKYERD